MSEVIVVGVSGAPVSARVVDWAMTRAAERSQRVELMSVVGGAIGTLGEGGPLAEATAASRSFLEDYVRLHADRGVEVSVRVDVGNPVERLVAASEDAALLVIGSDYQGGSSPSVRGFHGVRITAAAHCPVVVVPDFDPADRKGVVVGVDGSEISESALRFAAAEADRSDEPLTAVSVWTPLTAPGYGLVGYSQPYLDNMQTSTEEILAIALAGLSTDYPDLTIVPVVESGYPSRVLDELAATARLCVVGSRGRGAVRRFLLGSISQEVIAHPATVTAVVR
ncbi:universal stress protein [Microbacterium sp. MYb64]|uniref:universal stress protein n=1 Tax=Microbacterium sp. MYb64 TaxID=1848691 RepID=UPI000CFD6EA6|nr:universal stress protein [Microbacterium sp. MYb64]PRB07318.1 universal stress protein UspA [Microbacterium sp. MYb64]